MEIGFIALQKSMDEFLEVIGRLFSDTFNKVRGLVEHIIEIFEYKEKVKYKPVLKIEPSKLYYKDKSARNYYCRDNC